MNITTVGLKASLTSSQLNGNAGAGATINPDDSYVIFGWSQEKGDIVWEMIEQDLTTYSEMDQADSQRERPAQVDIPHIMQTSFCRSAAARFRNINVGTNRYIYYYWTLE